MHCKHNEIKALYNKTLCVHIAQHIIIKNNEKINVANSDVYCFSRPPCEDIHENTNIYNKQTSGSLRGKQPVVVLRFLKYLRQHCFLKKKKLSVCTDHFENIVLRSLFLLHVDVLGMLILA